MKIPKGYFQPRDENKRWQAVFGLWDLAAAQCSMEYGALVQVKIELGNRELGPMDALWPEDITRITFAIGEHRFEGLNELRSALKNKAFL